jgi:hypothetical protein
MPLKRPSGISAQHVKSSDNLAHIGWRLESLESQRLFVTMQQRFCAVTDKHGPATCDLEELRTAWC